MKTWIALFSHSGTEIAEIINQFKRPYYLYTNQLDRDKICGLICDDCVRLHHSDIMEDILYLLEHTKGEKIITLHGYMRIIPPEIINHPDVKIYNVHPGDIVNYPELRGKNPQEKALEMHLESTGVVIHKVDEGIDTGEIVARTHYPIQRGETLNDLVANLRLISIDMWIKLLSEILKDDE